MTGASGFIGGAVATALADREHEVIGFGRRVGGWSHPHARYRIWDLAAGPLDHRGDDEVDAVVHCAALADDWAPRETAMAINRDGTRAVIAAFPGARIVHLSTSSVYDALTPTVEARESEPMPPRFLSTYSESKAAAELELAGLDAVILRPHAVYGRGDTTLLPRVVDAVRRGRLPLPEGADVLHTLTHIDNVVRAVEAAISPATPRGTYNIGDDTPVVLGAVLGEILRRRDIPARIVRVPYATAMAVAGALEAGARLTGRRPRLTRYAVSQLGVERTLDLSAARRDLGYRPTPTVLDGVEDW